MSNKAELLKKIKALADRGVDGERESAQTLLTRLMEQYGISETDLEEERRETAWFRYSQETERRLLNQIIYMVTGRSGFGCVGVLEADPLRNGTILHKPVFALFLRLSEDG